MPRPPKKQQKTTEKNGKKLKEIPKYKDISIKMEQEQVRTEFYCCCCGVKHEKQQGKFSASKSPFFKSNNGYLPICRECVDKIYEQYLDILGSENEAIERVCLNWDMYYSPAALDSARKRKLTSAGTLVSFYVSIVLTNTQYKDKTYHTTLMERKNMVISSVDDIKENNLNVNPETIDFFGLGFDLPDYPWMDKEYKEWTKDIDVETKAQKELYRSIVINRLNFHKAQINNEKTDFLTKEFDSLMASLNIKPVQAKDNTFVEENTFGTLINLWENNEPIPEPEPEWKDVDGVAKNISVWFFGHLCKMLNIKNDYLKMYEEELNKYKMEQPEYFSENENEDELDEFFNGGSNTSLGDSNEKSRE